MDFKNYLKKKVFFFINYTSLSLNHQTYKIDLIIRLSFVSWEICFAKSSKTHILLVRKIHFCLKFSTTSYYKYI
jgi:hypothetical protein